jgi:exoribonuclease-2
MLNLDSLQQLKQLKSELKTNKPLLRGVVKGTSGRYGFVIDSEQKSHFLSPDEMAKVLPGDEVEFSITTQRDGKEQAEVESLKHSSWKKLVGQFVVKGKAQFLETDMQGLNRSFYIPPNEQGNALSGDYIECVLNRHPFPSGKPQATFKQVICSGDAPDFRHRLALARFNCSSQWSEEVQQAVAEITEERIEALALEREDLTEWSFVTIDSASTQDMDDALYAETLDNDAGWDLHVAIADPSALIQPGSALDLEAQKRVTSVYLPGMNIPMLPEYLTQTLCSLKPDQNRLAWVLSLKVSKQGNLSDPRYRRAQIRSKAKLSYHEVAAMLEKNQPQSDVETKVLALWGCAKALRHWREQQAIIMDERPDYMVQLDDAMNVVDIEAIHRNDAHRLVEECMLAANRTTAAWLAEKAQAAIYNTHPGFRLDRWPEVKTLLQETLPEQTFEALLLSEALPDRATFVRILQAVEATELALPLKAILLRNFDRGQLSLEAAPHLGMGIDAYTTFTSPIRKYSDLTTHRLLASLLEEGQSALKVEQSLIDSIQAGVSLARQVSQWVEQWYRCEYLQSKPKESVFTGEVVQLNPAGMVVRLDDSGVEGFVDLKRHKKSFRFDALRLTHQCDDLSFKLGDSIQVQTKRIDWIRRSVEFHCPE